MTKDDSGLASVLAAVEDVLPRLRANANEAEDRRWIPDENVALLEKAGVLRIATPRRFGGLALSLADQMEVLASVARGCPSTGWIAMVWASNAWITTLAADRVQEEVFTSGSVRVSGGFTPSGTLAPADGGYVLSGSWRFNSGCRAADWNIAASIIEHPGGEHEEAVAIVPMSEFTIADDWNTSAAAGTGSATSTAQGVFVPAHRVVGFGEALYGGSADRAHREPGRDYGLINYVMAVCAASFIGIARGAFEQFVTRVPGRAIAYTEHLDQSLHPLTQVQTATAANKIAAAEALAATCVRLMQDHADAGTLLGDEDRAIVRGKLAYVIQLAKEAVEIIFAHSGASAIHRSSPIQRHFRDIEGFALHGLLLASTNLEIQGRVLLGHDAGTPLL